jgi:hypothetical protein
MKEREYQFLLLEAKGMKRQKIERRKQEVLS